MDPFAETLTKYTLYIEAVASLDQNKLPLRKALTPSWTIHGLEYCD